MKNIFTSIILLCAFFVKAQNIAPTTAVASPIKLIFEKAYLHTDRDIYAQGDTLWFKAYLVNAQDNKPVSSSGNLYVELISPDSARIINRETIRLNNGLGNGDFELVDSLKAGKYRLRAYTNWMRNFGDNLVFEKQISILNTMAVPLAPDPKAAKNKGKDKNKPSTVPPATSTTATINLPVVRFYPEGGSLVEGISGIVAAKAENGYGSGIPVSGFILSAAGDTISSFSCDTLGMGLFALLPFKNQSYHAVVNPVAGGMPFRQDMVFELPSALSNGLTLQVKQTDSVIYAVVSNAAISGDAITAVANHPVTAGMTVKHSGKTLLSRQLSLTEPQTTFRLATSMLPEGVSAITIYDDQGKPECERLVYIHHPADAENKITVNTDKQSYQSKERVMVQINTPANTNLSMAVVDAGIVPEQADDIVSYLNLQSEIKGNIEQARRYFDTTNVNRFKQLDLLLLTQGWRDFVWRRLADTAIHISYAAENGIPVSGKIWDEARNKMLPGANVSLHADSAVVTKLFSTQSDTLGHFSFNNLMLYGKQSILLGSINEKGKDKGTILLDTLLPMKVQPMISRPAGLAIQADSAVTIAVEKKVGTMKKAKIAGVTRLKEVTIKAKQSIFTRNGNLLTTLGYPDQIFNITPKDYQYKTLEWFVLQNIKGAIASSKSFHGVVPTGVEFAGIDTPHTFVLMPPVLIVNGRELYMDEQSQAESYRTLYFNMPMNKFKKVELRHMVGTLHGMDSAGRSIVSIAIVDRFLLYLTMQDNYMVDNPGSLRTEITGYYKARNFYEPLPNAKPSVADYRTTIYWDPDIKTDATGKATISFYNAVPKTNVRVIVQGISPDGQPITSVTSYSIKQPD